MPSLSEHLGQIEPKVLDERLSGVDVNEKRRQDIREMFWRNDAYNSIISYPVYAELLIRFIQSLPDPNATFTRPEFYEFVIKNLASGEEGTKKLFIIGAALELLERNGLQPAEFESLLHELSITREQINYSGLIHDKILVEGIEPYDDTKTEKVYFSHHSIQEYLAAKYILSQESPLESLKQFVFIDEEGYKAIKPSWYNVIRFLVEIDSASDESMPIVMWLLSLGESEVLNETIVDEAFSNAITAVNQEITPELVQARIFELIYYTYQKRLLWVPIWTRDPLAELVTAGQLSSIKAEVEEILHKGLDINDKNRYVPLGLAVEVIDHVLEVRSEIISYDRGWWYEKLIEFANDKNDNGVLQRNALHSLVHFKNDDPTVNEALIKKVESSFQLPDDLIKQAFIDFCSKISPNSATTIGYIANSIGDFQLKVTSRFALQRIDNKEGVKNLLQELIQNNGFIFSFLDEESIFNNKDRNEDEGIIALIRASKDELYPLIDQVIKLSYELENYFHEERSYFLNALFNIAKDVDENYLDSILKHVEQTEGETKKGRLLDNYVPWISELLKPNEEELKRIHDQMVSIDQQHGQMYFERAVFIARNRGSEEGKAVFKKSKELGLIEYDEKKQTKERDWEAERKEKIIESYRELLGSEKRFSLGVFRFYLNNIDGKDGLNLEAEEERILELLRGTALKIDPRQFQVTIPDKASEGRSFNITSYYHMYGDALRVAQKLIPEELQSHRQQIIDLIPFAFSDDQQTILELITELSDEELNQFVNPTMSDRDKDIRYLIPSGYIYTIRKFAEEGILLKSPIPVLKSFIGDDNISLFDQRSALESLKLLISSDASDIHTFLKDIFQESLRQRNVDNQLKLAETANELLIEVYRDAEAISWRFDELINRAAPSKVDMTEPGFREVTQFESELHNMYFARPLISLKDPDLLDSEHYFRLVEYGFDLLNREEPNRYKSYAYYLWRIVADAIKNMTLSGNKPLQALKDFLYSRGYPVNPEFNWWNYRFEELNQAILAESHPQTVTDAVSYLSEISNQNGKDH